MPVRPPDGVADRMPTSTSSTRSSLTASMHLRTALSCDREANGSRRAVNHRRHFAQVHGREVADVRPLAFRAEGSSGPRAYSSTHRSADDGQSWGREAHPGWHKRTAHRLRSRLPCVLSAGRHDRRASLLWWRQADSGWRYVARSRLQKTGSAESWQPNDQDE